MASEPRRNSQIFVILVNIMQLQHMRMLDQFQNGNLPLNLLREKGLKGQEEEKMLKQSTKASQLSFMKASDVN